MADHRAIVDVVCKAGVKNLSTEIGALLGQELSCSDIKLNIFSKDDIFGDPSREKTALTRMTVSGDQEGNSFLLTRLDTAIILGGTLIMLPEDMIEEHVESGQLDGELADAFGEVANIVAGVFTQAFVDKYPKTLRFVKKTVEELVPTKIDMASSEPFPPDNYYTASCLLTLGDNSLGPIEFIIPAAILDLADSPAETAPAQESPAAAEPPPAAEPPAPVEEEKPEEAEKPAPEPEEDSAPKAAPAKKPAFADAKKLTDVIFKATIEQVGEEIGALLGQELVCNDIQLLMVDKESFFSEHCVEKSVASTMKVSGDREGSGLLIVQVPDAVVLGGTLIMLPEDQIEEQAQKNQYEGEVADAYGEVANILAGSLTQVFLDRYPQQLRFVRTESEILVPTKLDPDAETPIPKGTYYLASFAIALDGYNLERMLMLFPAELFDLDSGSAAAVADSEAAQPAAAKAETRQTAEETSTQKPATESGPAQNTGTDAPAEKEAPLEKPPLVLIISEKASEAGPFEDILSTTDYPCKVVTFQDDIKAIVQQHAIQGIFLIMNQVNERGFATAIKLQSTGQPLPPLIFAGPEWTRSAVLRAVKYGARDILVMPASGDEIQEKVSLHIRKAS